jgi:hypothetical protein
VTLPAHVALDDALLAVLRNAHPRARTTAQLAAALGYDRFDASAHVYPRLARLARHGVVTSYRKPERRDAYWTLAALPEPWPVGEWEARYAQA